MKTEIEKKLGQLETMVTKTWAVNNIRNSKARVGNYTSSEIVALTKEGKVKGTFGVPALTYIDETNMERRLGRSLTDDCNAKPLTWGKFLEMKVGPLLGDQYSFCSDVTITHPSIKYWVGSPDAFKKAVNKTVADTKCPLTLKSFCKLVDPLYDGLTAMDAMDAIRNGYTDSKGFIHSAHPDGEKFYWQLVSNGTLSNSQFAELIVYMPYLSELPEIQLMALNVEESQLSKHSWIAYAGEGELPFILDNGHYKNINIIRFEIPQADKDLVTGCVLKAGKMLIDNSITPEHKSESSAKLIEGIKLTKILS